MSAQFPSAPFEPNRGALRLMPGVDSVSPTFSAPPSLTYEPYYLLKEKPFSLSADPRFLYRGPAHAPAFDQLLNGIRRREGLIVLTGEIGTGKTTLIRSVLQHLDRRTFTAFVPDPFVSREDLLKVLLVDFGVVSIADLKRGSLAGASRPDLSYPLYEFLDSLVPLQAFAVLIIDEAQNLPLPLLEEIRILSDLEQREKLLQVVLVGQPELRSHLKLPEMRQVDQRVSVRCELAPLGQQDVAEYVRHRLSVAGGGESRVAFSEAAIATVFAGSGGVPRLVNLICDRALQGGQLARAHLIDARIVLEALEALGLDTPAAVIAAQPAEGDPAERAQTAAPPASRSSVPVASPEATAASLQVLSEFALANELSSRGRRVSFWRLAASLVLTAVAATTAAALWYLSVARVDAQSSPAPLPPRPAWTTPPAQIDPAAQFGPTEPSAVGSASSAPVVPAAAAATAYVIQVASFESRERADRLVEDLTSAGYRAGIVEFDLGPRGALLQIRVGGYTTVADAARDLALIRGLPGYADAHLLAN